MDNRIYELRRAGENDYEFIYQMKKDAYKKYVEVNYGAWDEEQQREYFAKFIEACKESAFVITCEGNDIGFYNGCLEGDSYEIGNICIVPEYQNRGIGTAILNDVLSENADKEIRLQYFKQNPVGRLYERLGFKLAEETAYHYRMVKETEKVALTAV